MIKITIKGLIYSVALTAMAASLALAQELTEKNIDSTDCIANAPSPISPLQFHAVSNPHVIDISTPTNIGPRLTNLIPGAQGRQSACRVIINVAI